MIKNRGAISDFYLCIDSMKRVGYNITIEVDEE